jgi:membrane associated rhomboid family serine protease
MDKSGNAVVDDGVFALIALNLGGYFADHAMHLPAMQNLYLPLDGGKWFQYGTSLFCHGDWEHLSGNLFFLFMFGKLVEERIGSMGVVLAFLACGLGANVISAWMLHEGTLVGASGAVFGLFMVSVLLRLRLEWRRILEVVILGQFVVSQVMEETERLGAQDGISHLTHVGGAITGAVFVAAITRAASKS